MHAQRKNCDWAETNRSEWDFECFTKSTDPNSAEAWSCVFYELARESKTVRCAVTTLRRLQTRANVEISAQRAKDERNAGLESKIELAELKVTNARLAWELVAMQENPNATDFEAAKGRYDEARDELSALNRERGSRLPRGMKALRAANRAGSRLLTWKARGVFVSASFAKVDGFPSLPWQSLLESQRRVLTRPAAILEPWPEEWKPALANDPLEVRFALTLNRFSGRGVIVAAVEKALGHQLDELDIRQEHNPPSASRILRCLALTRLRHHLPFREAEKFAKSFDVPANRDAWDSARDTVREMMLSLFQLPAAEEPRSDLPFAKKGGK